MHYIEIKHACGLSASDKNKTVDETKYNDIIIYQNGCEKMTTLILPENGKTVNISACYQNEFNNCKKFKDEKKLIFSLADNTTKPFDNTTPSPVHFKWNNEDADSILEISENSDFRNIITYTTTEKERTVYNLKKRTEYYWRVNGSEFFTFKTDDILPRWVKIDGVGNVRDLGGRINCDGKSIKQGLIFRGSRLEEDITDIGRRDFNNLGIKTELDLRQEALEKLKDSPIGENVTYIQIPCHGYDEFAENDISDGTCKKLIELFADENNYPIYFHCFGGQDRTGTLGFLLQAILGLDDETLLREYELTMLSCPSQKISRSRKGKFKPFIKYIKKNGKRKETLQANTITFLKDAGISEEIMNKIRHNLLE